MAGHCPDRSCELTTEFTGFTERALSFSIFEYEPLSVLYDQIYNEKWL